MGMKKERAKSARGWKALTFSLKDGLNADASDGSGQTSAPPIIKTKPHTKAKHLNSSPDANFTVENAAKELYPPSTEGFPVAP